MDLETLKINGWKDEKGHYWNDPNESEWRIYSHDEVVSGCYGGGTYYFIPGWFIGIDEDQWFYHGLEQKLMRYNRTREEYVARFLYNYTEVPKCAVTDCQNRVHLDSGKVSRGFTKTCCKSCGQTLANWQRWADENDYFNSDEYKAIKSAEMTDNISKWNYDPEFQANCKLGKLLNHEDRDDYLIYVAHTESGKFKFGVTRLDWVDWRKYVQSEYNYDPYITFHIIKIGNLKEIAYLEYDIKKRFNFQEYLNISKSSEFFKIFKELTRPSQILTSTTSQLTYTQVSGSASHSIRLLDEDIVSSYVKSISSSK